MTPNINIIDLAEKHGQTSYRNRADTKHPAYGFTEEGLQAFAHALLAAAPQAVQATEEMRVCNSEECGWIGPLSETYGYKNSPATLCPECKETTELSAPAHPAEGVPAQDSEWDGKLPERLQRALNALRLECPPAVADGVEFEVRSHYEAMHTSLSTSRSMYGAARDRLEAIDAAQPDPFAATQPAAQGLDAQDSWIDLKIAFDIPGDEVESLWLAVESGSIKLPNGWALAETTGSGCAGYVAIFRVDHLPISGEAFAVSAVLAAQAKQGGA